MLDRCAWVQVISIQGIHILAEAAQSDWVLVEYIATLATVASCLHSLQPFLLWTVPAVLSCQDVLWLSQQVTQTTSGSSFSASNDFKVSFAQCVEDHKN